MKEFHSRSSGSPPVEEPAKSELIEESSSALPFGPLEGDLCQGRGFFFAAFFCVAFFWVAFFRVAFFRLTLCAAASVRAAS